MKKSTIIMALLGILTLVSCGGGGSTQNASGDSTATAVPQPLTKAEFVTKIADIDAQPGVWKFLGQRPAVVDFYATWCGPCRTIAPILERLASQYAGRVDFYKVDVDQQGELAGAFGIQSIPTLLFIPMEGNPQMVQGALPEEDLKNLIQQVLLPEK